MKPEVVDVVIVGAGLAGAATAFFLTRNRGLRVLLLEQEREVGVHSSGRNAGLVRRASGRAELDPLCDEGAAFLAAPPADFEFARRFGATPFRKTGSFLLGAAAELTKWVRPGVRLASQVELAAAVPLFVPDPASAVLHCADDGVADTHAVLDGFLEGAKRRGAIVATGRRAGALRVEGGRVIGVATGTGSVAAGCVVDAAGAWAGEFVHGSEAVDPGLTPYRRHLMITAVDERIGRDGADWPWVWDLARGFYFRPEAGGLLVCACDDVAERPGNCVADPAMADVIAAKALRCLPDFRELRVEKLWAGHRTRRPDQRFLLGADPVLRGLVWAAGLGGHGLTSAAAVGRRVAEAVVGELGRERTAV